MSTVRVWKKTPGKTHAVQLSPIEIDDMLHTAGRNDPRGVSQRDNAIRWNIEEEIVTALRLLFKRAVALLKFIAKANEFTHQKLETQLATDTVFHLVYSTDLDHGKNTVITLLEDSFHEDQACPTVKGLH